MRSKRRATPGRGEGPCRQHDVTLRVTAQTHSYRLTRATLMREDAIHEEEEKKMAMSNEHTWFGWHASNRGATAIACTKSAPSIPSGHSVGCHVQHVRCSTLSARIDIESHDARVERDALRVESERAI